MKKLAILIIVLTVSTIGLGQTEKIETENLTKMFQDGEFTQEGYLERAEVWRSLLIDYGGYPSLPFNEKTKTIQFINQFEFPSLSKKEIYNRILEWSAVNFGNINEVLHYENFESGKLILKGNFKITHKTTYKNFWGKTKETVTSKTCLQTYIFTIKDNKLKLEITGLRYKYKVYGHYTGSYYHPTEIYEISIHEFYPITEFEPEEWKENLDMIYQTHLKIQFLTKYIESYINDYQSDYQF